MDNDEQRNREPNFAEEMAALQRIYNTLAAFPAVTRARMMTYLHERFRDQP